jgi:hypothetical protein
MRRIRVLGTLLLLAPGAAAGQGAGSQPGVSGSGAGDGRPVSLLFQGARLDAALDQLVQASGISLLYAPDLVRSQRIYCRGEGLAAEVMLRCIVREAGLDFYRLSTGTYVVIRSVAEAPQYGSLAGMVVDEATGDPLPSARVSLDCAGSMTESTVSGLFSFASLPPGRYRLEARAIGYRPVVQQVDIPPAGQVRQRVTLTRQAVDLGPLVVNGVALSPMQGGLASASVAADSLADVLAGPSTLLRAAGVQLGLTQRRVLGDLHIQGGDAGEHQFRLDGVPVFDPLPPGRLFGAFSPLAIERLTIRRTGFGVAHGSYSAGVIDLEQSIDAGSRPAGEVAADPYAFAARLATPWEIGGRRASAMAAVRTSLWGVVTGTPLQQSVREWTTVDRVLLDRLRGPVAGVPITDPFVPTTVTSDLGFTDVHLGSRLELGHYETVSGSVYAARQRVGTDLVAEARPAGGAPVSLRAGDHFNWSEFAGQVRYDRLIGSRTSHMVQARASRHALRHTQSVLIAGEGAPDALPHERNEVHEVGLAATVRHAVDQRTVVEGGVEVAHIGSSMVMQNEVYRPMAGESAALRTATYGEVRRALGASTALEAGLRLTWVPSRRAVYAEPRLALAGDRASASGAFAWRIATGVHRQFIGQFDLASVGPSALVPSVRIWLPVGATLAPPLAWHLSAEGAWRLAGGWELRAESYLRLQPTIQAIDYASLLDQEASGSFIAEVRGYAVGGGVRASRSFGPVRVEAGYDLGLARRSFPSRFGGELQPTPWNEPHRALLMAELRASRTLAFSALARGVWGRTWALRQAYYDLLTTGPAGAGLAIGNPGASSLPPLYEVDLGAAWSSEVAGVRLELGAAVLNAFGRRNVLDEWLMPESTPNGTVVYARVPRATIGRQPMVTVRVGG